MASISRPELFNLVTVRNPFRPAEREITPLPVEGRAVASYLPSDLAVVAGLNGRILNADEIATTIPRAGDFLAICPVIGKGGGGGKNPLATIAAIALTVVTFGGGGLLAGGLFAGGATSWLMAGALLYLGGSLMGGMSAKAARVDMPDTSSSAWENGHSWGDMQPISRQGGTVPNTYGTVRITGQILNQHVTSDGKKQYLNVLLCGGEGPVDSVSDIKINNNPSENFGGIADDDELFDTTPGITLDAVGETALASTPVAATALDIELYWPNGMLKNGTFWGGSVGIKIEYQPSGGAWVVWKTETVTQRSYQAFSRTYRIDGLTGAIYQTRITLTSADATTYAFQYKRLSYVQKAVAVEIETRTGTNTQTPISFFGDSFADQVFSIELSDDGYAEYQTEGDGGSGLEISIAFPSGLCYVNDDGSPSESWVKIDADYRLVGAPTWTSWLAAQEIRDKKNGAVRRTFRKDGLTQGQYEVRAKVNSVHGTGSRFINQAVWNSLSHIIYDDFKRPGKVLVGIRAMATDKLSGGMPSISWLQTRSTVNVYVPGSGYTTKAATNPAWICYDLIHRARYLEDPRTSTSSYVVRGDPHARIDYSAFEAWAAYCDEVVDGMKRCEANIHLDAAASLWDQLQKVAQIGRGMVVLRGTQFSCVFDGQVSTPVQMFTVGNILEDSLNGEYLTSRDRANAIEISFNNADKDYQRDVVMVYGDDYDGTAAVNSPTQVTLPGITDYRRAYREGLYRLRLNKYIKRSISFQADIDALACQVGDVVLVQHDVPRWGNGGRVVSATANSITLDKAVHMSPGTTYSVKVRLGDGTIVDKTVSAVLVDTDTATLTLTTAWSTQPVAYDLYAFGAVDLATKPFRVTKIARSGDLRVRIDATEYYPEVYDETATVPEVDYTVPLPTISGLVIGFRFDLAGHAFLDISWSPPRGSYGGAVVMIDGRAVGRVGISQSSYSHQVTKDKTYSVGVIGLDALGNELATVSGSYTVTALSIPTVSGLTLAENTYQLPDGTWLTDVGVSWTGIAASAYQYISGYTISYEVNGDGVWHSAGTSPAASTIIKALETERNDTIKVKIEAFNRWGISGAPVVSSALTVVGKSAPPSAPGAITGTQDPQNKAILNLTWGAVTDLDLRDYELRVGGTGWADATLIAAHLTTPRYAWSIPGAGTYTIRAKSFDTLGNASTETTASFSLSVAPSTPSGLSAAYDEQNRGIAIITWTPSTDLDVKRYELRVGGSSWETASVIGDKLADPITSYTLPASGTFVFRLKAINRAGYYSAEATLTIELSVEPNTVTGLTATQDPANRTRLNVSWTPSSEKDVKRYEVRMGGSSWATATVVGDKIADPYTTVTLSSEGPTTIRVKAINRAGFYSENDATIIADINLTPSDVTGFQALQNGDNILVSWTRVADQDLLGYRIVEGPAYALGALFAEADPSKSQVEVPVSAERDYTLRIKAINRAGYESANDASATVTVSNLTPRNVIQSFDELVLQSGTHSNTAFGSSQYTMATLGGRMSDWPTLRMDAAGSANVLKLATGQTSGTYTCVTKDMGEIITAHIAVDWFVLALYGSGQAARLEFRTSLNGTTWTDWLVFAPATQTFRYVAFRAVLTTTDVAKTPEVTLFTISIDVPDKELIFRDHSIAAAGTELNFGHTYHVIPSVAVTSLGDNTHGVLVSKTTEKCTLKIRNFITGAYVSGTADIRVRGY